jgi:hypothetical protein
MFINMEIRDGIIFNKTIARYIFAGYPYGGRLGYLQQGWLVAY